MAQTTYTVLNPVGLSGSAFVNEYNVDFAGVISMNSGPNAPTGPVAGMMWMQTGDSSALPIHVHDGGSGASAWIHALTLDAVNHWPRFAVDADHDTYISRTSTDGQIGFTIEGGTGAVFSSSGMGWGAAVGAGVSLDFSALRGAIRPPRGTTAQRPSNPQNGDTWFNTTLNKWEIYLGGWKSILVTGDSGGGGATNLPALTDVSISNQSSGQALVATGTNTWGNGAVSSAGIQSDAVTGVKIADNAVGSSHIANNAITSAKIATGAVGSTEIASNAVGSSEIASNAVGSSEIAANAVGASELNVSGNGSNGQFLRSDGDGSMSWANVSSGGGGGGTPADGSITTAKLANGAVSTAKLANDAVTNAKLADNSVTAAILKVAGNGQSGQYLVSDGNGGFSWITPSGGGGTPPPSGNRIVGTINANSQVVEFTGIPSSATSFSLVLSDVAVDHVQSWSLYLELGTSSNYNTSSRHRITFSSGDRLVSSTVNGSETSTANRWSISETGESGSTTVSLTGEMTRARLRLTPFASYLPTHFEGTGSAILTYS